MTATVYWTRGAGRRRAAALLAAAVAAVAAALGAVPAAQAFVQHRAVYDLSLAKVRSSQAANSIDGRMQFTWRDVCDGWSVDYVSQMQVNFAERGSQRVGWRYSAWEADDGSEFRFFTRRLYGGEVDQRRRGSATLAPDGGGQARFAKPESRTVDLPADTLFPQAHSAFVLKQAKAGRTFVWRHVFDGTGEDDGLFGVSAVIAREIPANRDLPLEHPLVADQRSWRVALAYFPTGARSATPESEQSARIFANGVTGTLTIDYGDFVVRAELTELEKLAPADCE
jgi:hypothetical protein